MSFWKVKKVPESLWDYLNQSANRGAPPQLLELQVNLPIYTNTRLLFSHTCTHNLKVFFFPLLLAKPIDHPNSLGSRFLLKLKIVLCLFYLHNFNLF